MRAAGRVLLAAVLLLAAFGWARWWDLATPSFFGPRYQAVFLSNGATYFGQYHDRFGPYVKLENPYYVETPKNDAGEALEPRLVRRGGELHGPLPRMLIPRDAVLFVEDVGPTSPLIGFMEQGR